MPKITRIGKNPAQADGAMPMFCPISGAWNTGTKAAIPPVLRMPVFGGSMARLHVTRGSRQNPLHHAFVNAAKEAGYDATADYNGHQQEGFGPADMTIWKGRRWSAANAYLKPAIKNHGVRLLKGALVDKINFINGRA
jgi:choline dehydrogenase-like flavoprotein